MNGAKKMKISQNVKNKISQLTEIVRVIPEVSVTVTSEISGSLHIDSHFPLESVSYSYSCENRFWTQNYNLQFYSHSKTSLNTNAKIILKSKYNSYYFFSNSTDSDVQMIVSKINSNVFVKKILKNNDFISFTIEIKNRNASITCIPIHGSIIRLLIPPTTYFVKPTVNEIVNILQLFQLLLKHICA